MRFVFPEMKEKSRKIRVHLNYEDLRWGISQADTQDGMALDICLDEIDFCRPYFLGLLGHRYGWIRDGETFDPGTGREFVLRLMEHSPLFPIILHTSNYDAAIGMLTDLELSAWEVVRAIPMKGES